MKQLFIPNLGTEIELAEDWHFKLFCEYRNHSLSVLLGLPEPSFADLDSNHSSKVSLPQGSILKVDRIYIRKGQNEYSSVTFNLKKIHGEKVVKVRFWAKLDDVNNIKFMD